MKEFLEQSRAEREQLLQEATARYTGIEDPIIMEKDFWVCWALNQLYSIPQLKENITFKGGTSLSKCFKIIERFSEDCDLTIEKSFLGITQDNDPRTATSQKKTKNRLENLKELLKEKVSNEIYPLIREKFDESLTEYFSSKEWSIEQDLTEPETLLFHYPSSLGNINKNKYIIQSVKLEFGARGDRTPAEKKLIQPYLIDVLPKVFNKNISIEVHTLSIIRTYWEKITLLHAEHHRSMNSNIPKRLFRHYYDVVMLDQNNITEIALKNLILLQKVVENKKIFFRSSWAKYDEAKVGSLKLTPNKHFISDLKDDQKDMVDMFFGPKFEFDDIIDKIRQIENKLNVL